MSNILSPTRHQTSETTLNTTPSPIKKIKASNYCRKDGYHSEEAGRCYEEAIAKIGQFELVIAELMQDIQQIEDLHKKVLDTLKKHRFSYSDQQGYFIFNERLIKQTFDSYMESIKSKVDRDCKLFCENFEASKGTIQPDQLYFELGEPLLKSELQVGNLSSA